MTRDTPIIRVSRLVTERLDTESETPRAHASEEGTPRPLRGSKDKGESTMEIDDLIFAATVPQAHSAASKDTQEEDRVQRGLREPSGSGAEGVRKGSPLMTSPEGRYTVERPAVPVPNLDAAAANPFTVDRLRAGVTNFHELSKGSIQDTGLLLSEIAQYPLPPAVIRRILGMVEDEVTGPSPCQVDKSLLLRAILQSEEVITPQWYIEPLERHIQRYRHVAAVMAMIGPEVKAWHEHNDGDLKTIGLLLADMSPAPDTGNPLPRGIVQRLLNIGKDEQKCPWLQFEQFFTKSLSMQDSAHSISQLLASSITCMGTRTLDENGSTDSTGTTQADERIRCSGSGVAKWRTVLREWLMEEEEFEAIPDIATLWEDPTTTFPRRAWIRTRDFFEALNTNTTVWIHKLRKQGLSTLAAHATSFLGSDGSEARRRQARNEKLLLNKEAWNATNERDKVGWLAHLAIVGHQVRSLCDPKMSSWNVGPHGFRGGRLEIFAVFEAGDPVICLQDLRIPKKRVKATKDELHALFPHYWIFIS